MVVNIYNTALKYSKVKESSYRVLRTGAGFMVEYKLPQTGEKIYIPASSESEYRSIIGRLNNPGFIEFLYKNRALMAKNKKKPSPEQRRAGAKKTANVFAKYLNASGENTVSGWAKYALSKKQIPLRTRKKDYALGMGLGPLEKGGSDYFTSLVIPTPGKGGIKPAWGEIKVTDALSIIHSIGAKEYKAATGKLSKHSKAWAELLKHVKVKAKNENTIRNGSLAEALYANSIAA